jgi:hypothetical protein
MLAFMDIPDWLEDLHEQAREIGEKLYQPFADIHPPQRIPRNTEQLRVHDHHIYVVDGLYKFIQDDRMVRLISPQEWCVVESGAENRGQSIVSDFGTEVAYIPSDAFHAHLAQDPETELLWRDYLSKQNQIALGLSGLYAHEELRPDVRLVRYEAGDVIINQGDQGDEIYELVEGDARADINGITVGIIKAGEFFGEMSLLVQEPRNATVRANRTCCVHIISRDDFERIVRCRPSLSLSIAKTLAERVRLLNKKLIDLSPDLPITDNI